MILINLMVKFDINLKVVFRRAVNFVFFLEEG